MQPPQRVKQAQTSNQREPVPPVAVGRWQSDRTEAPSGYRPSCCSWFNPNKKMGEGCTTPWRPSLKKQRQFPVNTSHYQKSRDQPQPQAWHGPLGDPRAKQKGATPPSRASPSTVWPLPTCSDQPHKAEPNQPPTKAVKRTGNGAAEAGMVSPSRCQTAPQLGRRLGAISQWRQGALAGE